MLLFISIVFSVYILFGKDKLKSQICRLIRAWIPKNFGEWLIHASIGDTVIIINAPTIAPINAPTTGIKAVTPTSAPTMGA